MDIGRLYTEIAPRLTNYLAANGVAYASACDIVQETFLRIWKMRETLIDEVDQVSGLAYTIARNLRTDQFRKTRREVLQDEIKDEDAGSVDPAALPSDGAYLRARLTEALAQLPPLLREAYTLFQVQELSIREIARRTNAGESAVKVRIFRAKEKLRGLLADLMDGTKNGGLGTSGSGKSGGSPSALGNGIKGGGLGTLGNGTKGGGPVTLRRGGA